jgi:hypothetical protein
MLFCLRETPGPVTATGLLRRTISLATWTLPLARKDLKRMAETGGILARRHGGEFAPADRVSKRYGVSQDLFPCK